MLNFKLIKRQYKTAIILMAIFFALFLFMLMPIAATKSFYQIDDRAPGAIQLINIIIFGPAANWILIFSFSIILTHLILTKEIDRGYISMWLTLPISRKSIILSKLFILVTSIMILCFGLMIFQLIVYSLAFSDFKQEEQIRLVLSYFSFMLLSIMWALIIWTVANIFNRPIAMISIASGISIAAYVFNAIAWGGNMAPAYSVFRSFRYFKYITFISLFNSAFNVEDGVLMSINALGFAWQIPTMLVITAGLTWFSTYKFINNNFSI